MGRMKFKVEIDEDRVYKFDLEEELKITEEQIDEHLAKQPSQFAWYATIAAMAKAKSERVEYELDEYEHRLDLDLRETAGKEEVKMTEGKLKSLIVTDAKRLSIVNKLMEAKEQMEVAIAARDAFSQRKDCLISIGANRRAQYDVDLNLRKK